jgi:hypothetical protein
MAIDPKLQAMLDKLGSKLATRGSREAILDGYYSGAAPLPRAVIASKMTNAYAMLMSQATAPWGATVVDAVADRLEVTGIDSGDKAVDQALWGLWQDSQVDAESKLVHSSALISGRAYGMVWPDPDDDDGRPEFSFDSSAQMIVQYEEGSRRERVAAMRYWNDDDDPDDVPCATLYLPDGIYKFVGSAKGVHGPQGVTWEQRMVDGEEWPVPNPFGVVPVVELPVNRRLKPGCYPYARGEFEHVLGLIDRINLLTFLGLVVAFSLGFPLRVLIGEKIIRDDDDNPLPPFTVGADQLAQLENPDAKIDQFTAADRSTLSIFAELDQLAALTKTPVTYFPSPGSISNLSADAIRGLESGLVAKIPKHKVSLGEGWEELLRVGGMQLDTPVELSPRAELTWSDHENRSLAERADAASKLVNILPQAALLEYVLNLTAEQIARIQTQRAGDALSQLVAAAAAQKPGSPPSVGAGGGPPQTLTAPAAPTATQNGGGG